MYRKRQKAIDINCELLRKTNFRDTLRFDEDDILQILLSDLEQRKIAKKYNISQSLISQIKTGKIYKHLFPDILRISEPIISKNDKLYTKYC